MQRSPGEKACPLQPSRWKTGFAFLPMGEEPCVVNIPGSPSSQRPPGPPITTHFLFTTSLIPFLLQDLHTSSSLHVCEVTAHFFRFVHMMAFSTLPSEATLNSSCPLPYLCFLLFLFLLISALTFEILFKCDHLFIAISLIPRTLWG